MSLPPELIDAIVDEVHDVASLRALSVVSKDFRPRSQAMIFRNLHIPSLRVLDLFSNVVAGSPHIASLPLQVILTDDAEFSYYALDHDLEPERSWLSQESKLFTIMQSLPRLEAITINMSNCRDALNDSNTPLCRLFSLPSICSVTLDGSLDMTCHRLFSLFIGTSVRALELDRCGPLPRYLHSHSHSKCAPGLLARVPRAPRLHLTSLSIVLTPCRVAYLASPACIVNLTTLKHLTLSTANNRSVGRLRSAISELFNDNLVSLEVIDCVSSLSELPADGYYNFARSRSLKRLTLKLTVDIDDADVWTYMANILQSVTSTCLERLIIDVEFVGLRSNPHSYLCSNPYCYFHKKGQTCFQPAWYKLDEALSKMNHTHLRDIDICFTMNNGLPDECMNEELVIAKGFPLLRFSGFRFLDFRARIEGEDFSYLLPKNLNTLSLYEESADLITGTSSVEVNVGRRGRDL